VTNVVSAILLVDKPMGVTSHDVVAKTRRAAGTRKVGHAGTLDPMATGLLILGIESATRLLTYVVGADKEYFATIRLGQTSSTDDAEGELGERAESAALGAATDEAIAQGIAALTGEISQRPSSVSAIKVGGKRAYARVRDGEEVVLAERSVTVSTFEVLDRRDMDGFVDLDVRVECSSGTYIRALARDLGVALGVGGHLTALRRTRVGPFRVEGAPTLAEIMAEGFDVAGTSIAPADAAAALFPVVNLDEHTAVDLGHGKRIPADILPDADGPIAAIAPDGRLIGLVEKRGGAGKTVVNFPPDPAQGGAR
jgi:tRNA pseudouridine55 synthase